MVLNWRLQAGAASKSCTSGNALWTLRHGQSKANAAGLIVSDLNEGKKAEYGLTDIGRQQAHAAGLLLLPQLEMSGKRTHVHASPFSRTVETARECARACQLDDTEIHIEEALRERYFGEFEGKSHDNYPLVWEEDEKDINYRPDGGGESVQDVADRLEPFLRRLDSKYAGDNVLLVAHGDTLSILWAVYNHTPLQRHRDVALQTGELRRLP